ncbi:MAG: hypothetical protein U1F53_23135 [Burkholderiaceae bacterium]
MTLANAGRDRDDAPRAAAARRAMPTAPARRSSACTSRSSGTIRPPSVCVAAPAALRLSAAVDGTLATGPMVLRVGASIVLHGVGALVDGRSRRKGVTLRCDRERGLQLGAAGGR